MLSVKVTRICGVISSTILSLVVPDMTSSPPIIEATMHSSKNRK